MTHRANRRRRKPVALRSDHRGSVLVSAMIMLGVVSALAIAMLRASMLQSRQARQELHRAQAECLLDAGLDRAAAQLRMHPEYTGEACDLSPNQIVDRHAGRVVIRIMPPTDDQHGASVVEVTAEYPVGSPFAVRRSRSYLRTPSRSPDGR